MAGNLKILHHGGFSYFDFLGFLCVFNLLPFTYEVRMFRVLFAELPKSGIGVGRSIVTSAR